MKVGEFKSKICSKCNFEKACSFTFCYDPSVREETFIHPNQRVKNVTMSYEEFSRWALLHPFAMMFFCIYHGRSSTVPYTIKTMWGLLPEFYIFVDRCLNFNLDFAEDWLTRAGFLKITSIKSAVIDKVSKKLSTFEFKELHTE